MPTSYTADISKGITFKEYALLCARNFGATIMMRDEPLDAEIPEFQPSDYYVKRIYEIQKEINTLENLTKDDLKALIDKDYAVRVERINQVNLAQDVLENKYENMLSQVRLWQPPTPEHTNLKEFMITQIEDTIYFDCSFYANPDKVERKDDNTWLKGKLNELYKSITYHEIEHKKEVDRTNNRNKWVKVLRDSL